MPRGFIALGTAIVILAGTAGGALAEQKFVPQGHSYGPGNDKLPPLNSYQDRITGQTDIYQTEIYNYHRDKAIWQADMDRLIQHDFAPGVHSQPRY